MLTIRDLLLVMAALALLSTACPTVNQLNPQPFMGTATWVTEATHNWLDVRMDQQAWDSYVEDQPWGLDSLDAICLRLAEYGDFARKLQDFKTSERYAVDDDALLLLLVQHALETYQYHDGY